MPPQNANPPKDKTPTPSVNTAVPDDKTLREDWSKLSTDDKNRYFSNLSAEEQVKFGQRVGLFESKEPVSISAHPKMGTIPWMKEKAYGLLGSAVNQLPTVEGTAGGIVGGVVGGAADILGGEWPGAIAGAGIGGAHGEYDRQRLNKLFNLDPYAKPETTRNKIYEIGKQGIEQAGAEIFGQMMGKALRPTLDRSISKIIYAGNLSHGTDVMGSSNVRKVISDLIATEKNGQGKALTVKDLFNVVHSAKSDIGQTVDLQYALPAVGKNGKTMLLGQVSPNPDPIINAINSKFSSSPSVTVLAKINPAGPEAAYLQRLKNEALNYSKHNWTYSELADRRIHLNEEIGAIYALPPGEKRVAMLASPDLAYKQAEADAIRDITYPEMDRLAKQPLGTTRAMQEKRGALMSIENEIHHHLGDLQTKVARAQGANPWDKINASGYITSSGKPGGAVHRVTSLVHTPNALARADKQVAKAFGHGIGPNARRLASTPSGMEIMSLPLREYYNPSKPEQKKPEDEDNSTDGPQSSVAKPKELLEQAKQLNPVAQGQVAYAHVAVNPATGHRIGSHDGNTWYDHATGAQVA